MSLLQQLHQEFPLLAKCLLPKLTEDESDDPAAADDTGGVELVLRDAMFKECAFDDLLENLRRLGRYQQQQQQDSTIIIANVYLYKDFLVHFTEEQLGQFYLTLGQTLGGAMEELSLSFVRLEASHLATVLRQTPHLKNLYLGRVSLLLQAGPGGAAELYAALQSLTELQEFHCSLAPAPRALHPMFQFDEMDDAPQATQALDPLLLALSKLDNLRKLYLTAYKPRGGLILQPSSLAALVWKNEESSKLEDLTLWNCPLTQDHVKTLLSAPRTTTQSKLKSLALMQAEMGDAGAQVIADQCLLGATFPDLEKLYLPGNHLSNAGGNAIVTALRSSCGSLKVLDLHDNRLKSRFGRCLGQTLGVKGLPLQFLDVSYNPLGDAGGIAIACALSENTELEQLNLFCNQLSDVTCNAMAAALKCNRQLRQLNLYNNHKISFQGLDSLIQKIEHDNYVLQRLEVNFSTILQQQSNNSNHHDREDNNNDLHPREGQQPPLQVQERRQKQAALDFVLNLNRKFDRQTLLRNDATTDDKYLEQGVATAAARDDLNSLFYFLKAKPTFFCNTNDDCQDDNGVAEDGDGADPEAATTTHPQPCSRQRLSVISSRACDILREVDNDDAF